MKELELCDWPLQFVFWPQLVDAMSYMQHPDLNEEDRLLWLSTQKSSGVLNQDLMSLLKHLTRTHSGLFSGTFDPTTVDSDELAAVLETGGGSVMRVLEKIKKLEEQGHTFERLADIIPVLQVTGVSETEDLQLKTELLRAYITDPGCMLLYHQSHTLQPEPTPLTEAQLDRLVSAAPTPSDVIGILRSLEANHCRYNSVEEVCEAVEAISRQQLLKEDLLSIISEKKLCDTEVTVEDVDRLVEAAQGFEPDDLLSHVESYEHQERSFADADELIKAVAEAATQLLHMDTYANQRELLRVYMATEGRALYNGSGNTGASPEICDERLDWLVEQGGDPGKTRLILKRLLSFGKQYKLFSDLCVAVRQERYAGFDHEKDIFEFLTFSSSIGCRLLETPISIPQVSSLYHSCQAGRHTISHLKFLAEHGRQFATVESLVTSIKQVHSQATIRMEVEKNLLSAFLSAPSCSLFLDLAEPSDADLYNLLFACKSGITAMHMLNTFNQDTKFVSLYDLVPFIEEQMRKPELFLDKIRDFLASPEGVKLLPVKKVEKINPEELNSLFVAGGGEECAAHLTAFSAADLSFSSVDSLCSALRSAHLMAHKYQFRQRAMIATYFLSEKCSLWSRIYPVSGKDIDALVHAAGGSVNALVHLLSLNREGRAFQQFKHLVEAIHQKAFEVSQVQLGVQGLLNDKGCPLWATPLPAPLTIQQVSQLFRFKSVGLRSPVPDVLSRIESVGEQFHSFKDLTTKVFAALEKEKTRMLELVDLLRIFFANHLVFRTTRIEHADLLEIIDILGPVALYRVEKLLSLQEFSNISQLITAIRESLTQASEALLPFCTEAKVFKQPRVADEDDIAQILEVVPHADEALVYLTLFEMNRQKFRNFDEVLSVLKETYLKKSRGASLMLVSYLLGNSGKILPSSATLTFDHVEDMVQKCSPAYALFDHLDHAFSERVMFTSVEGLKQYLEQRQTIIVEHQQKCLEYLQHCQLFTEQSMPEVTDVQVEKLFKHSRGYLATFQYLRHLDRHHENFKTFGSFIAAVLKLSRGEKEAEAALVATFIEREANYKDYLRQHLSTAECRLFTHSDIGPKMTTDIFERLLGQGGGAETTALFIAELERSGEEFDSFTSLNFAIKDKFDKMQHCKQQVQSLLSSPECQLLTLATKPARPIELRFRNIVPNKEHTISAMYAADRLFKEAKSGEFTLRFLKELEREPITRQYSIDQLVEKVQVKFSDHIRTEDQHAVLMAYLDTTSDLLKKHCFVTKEDLNNLIKLCKFSFVVLFHLQNLNRQHEHFDSMQSLQGAVAQAHVALSQRIPVFLKFFVRHGPSMFRSPAAIGHPEVERLLKACGGHSESAAALLVHLRRFKSKGSLFKNVDELAVHLKRDHEKMTSSWHNESVLIASTYLLDEALEDGEPDCPLSKGIVCITPKDIEKLMEAAGSIGNMVANFGVFLEADKSFNFFQDLLAAMSVRRRQAFIEKRNLVKVINNSRIFSNEGMKCTVNEINYIITWARAGGSLEKHINSIASTGASFPSIDSLCDRVQEVHFGRPKQSAHSTAPKMNINETLLAVLNNPSSKVFSAPLPPFSLVDIESLVTQGGTAAAVKLFLNDLQLSGIRFDTFDDLCFAVRQDWFDSFSHKQEIFDYLQAGHITFRRSRGTITKQDVEMLYVGGEAGKHTLDYLKSTLSKVFPNFGALIVHVRETQHSRIHEIGVEKAMLQVFLQGSTCTLFPGMVQPTDRDVYNMIMAGRSGPNTLYLLTKMNDRRLAFDSVEELLRVIEYEVNTGSIHIDDILAFFAKQKQSDRSLLPGDLEFTKKDAAHLFHEGGGSETIPSLWLLSAKGRSFANVPALISGLFELHQNTLTQVRMMVLYITRPECKLFTRAIYGTFDFGKLGVEANYPRILAQTILLETSSTVFDSFDQYQQRLTNQYAEYTEQIQALTADMKSSTFPLFEKGIPTLQEVEVERMHCSVTHTFSLTQLRKYLTLLETQGVKVWSMEALAFAVNHLHKQTMSRYPEQKWTCLSYLWNGASRSFPELPNPAKTMLTVDNLVMVARSVPVALALLMHFLPPGSASSLSSLVAAAGQQMEQKLVVSVTVKYISEHNLLPAGLKSSILDVENSFRVVPESCDPLEVFILITMLRGTQSRFNSFQELDKAIADLWGYLCELEQGAELMMLSLLFAPFQFGDNGNNRLCTSSFAADLPFLQECLEVAPLSHLAALLPLLSPAAPYSTAEEVVTALKAVQGPWEEQQVSLMAIVSHNLEKAAKMQQQQQQQGMANKKGLAVPDTNSSSTPASRRHSLLSNDREFIYEPVSEDRMCRLYTVTQAGMDTQRRVQELFSKQIRVNCFQELIELVHD